MSNQLTSIDFHGQTLLATVQDNVVYTALKPICENIGLSWNAQFERIKRDEVLVEGIRMIRTPTKGGFQDVVCLPLTLLNGWLFGVDTNRVKAEIKETLITYKKECYQALFDYWHKGVAVNPRRITISIEQQSAIRNAVKKRCKSESVHYATVYEAIKQRFDIPRYTELLASDFDECMALIASVELAPIVPNTPTQSYLTKKDLLTLAKVMDYARLYADFASKMMNKDEQDNIATMYAKNDGSDDGFFVCYRPNHQSDINKAFELFINLAKQSSVQSLAIA